MTDPREVIAQAMTARNPHMAAGQALAALEESGHVVVNRAALTDALSRIEVRPSWVDGKGPTIVAESMADAIMAALDTGGGGGQ